MAYLINKKPGVMYPDTLKKTNPWELGDNVDNVAPAGAPIMSVCLIVEKMAFAVSDGKNGWHLKSTDGSVKSIQAGSKWSDLF